MGAAVSICLVHGKLQTPGHGASMSPEERKQLLGYDFAELGSVQWPSRQAIEAHDMGYMRHLMGVSCFFFAASFLIYRHLKNSNMVNTDKYLAHRLACFIAYSQAFQAILSVSGDYIFAEDDASLDTCYGSYCNTIDNACAVSIGVVQVGIVLPLQLYHRTPTKPMAINILCFVLGMICKKIASSFHRQMYWDTCPQAWTTTPVDCIPGGARWTANDYRNCFDFRLGDRRKLQQMHIFYILFYHILWHILAPLASCIQVHTLITSPFGATDAERARRRFHLSVKFRNPSCKPRMTQPSLAAMTLLFSSKKVVSTELDISPNNIQ